MYEYLEQEKLLSEEQKGYRRGSRRTKDQLLIDKTSKRLIITIKTITMIIKFIGTSIFTRFFKCLVTFFVFVCLSY